MFKQKGAFMLKVGITGGIGCGKSEVSKILREQGIPIIPADLVARKLMNSDEEIRSSLIESFGEDVYFPNGRLNRKRVSEIIFNDEPAKEKINRIVHPKVIEAEHRMLEKLFQSGHFQIAGIEAALIYESGSDKYFDLVIVVSASPETVIQRLKIRDDTDEIQIQKRIESQMPLSEKIRRADYVIHNNGTLNDLKSRTKALARWLQEKANSPKHGTV